MPDCEHEEIDWSCRSCKARVGRQNYQDNKDRYANAARRRQDRLRERINAVKSQPCADCRLTFDPVCMDFDHLPGFEKSMNISYGLRHRMAWNKIEAEIEKCEVVCANCHRLRTKLRGENVDL